MDPILYWMDVALEAIRASYTNKEEEQPGPTLDSRALAIVHGAMYDAVASVSDAAVFGNPTNLPPYLISSTPAWRGASEYAAVAAAAHATLSKLFPSQKPYFDLKHAQAGLE